MGSEGEPDEKGDDESDVCEDPRAEKSDDGSDVCLDFPKSDEEDEEAKPSIGQDSELYLEAVRLGVIAEENPELLSSHIEQIKKSLSEHWSDIMKAKTRLYASALEAL